MLMSSVESLRLRDELSLRRFCLATSNGRMLLYGLSAGMSLGPSWMVMTRLAISRIESACVAYEYKEIVRSVSSAKACTYQ